MTFTRRACGMLTGCCLAASLACFAAQAGAEPVRILVAVGHGTGYEGERALRHAEQDAYRVVGALTSLGGVDAANASLLRGPTLAQLRASLAQAREAAARRSPGDVTFIFYYSGHGDQAALHVGAETLPLDELKGLVQQVPAAVRLVVLDACRSTRSKGMSAEPGFAISLGKPSGTSGTAWLFASADGEAAQESDQLGGAVFTHAWVTGLRGAADTNGDRRVTLAESYAYAFHQTLVRSAKGSGVLQRPSARFDLSEVEPVTVTELGGESGFLLFPKQADTYYLVYSPRSSTVAAELWSATDRVVALNVPPGRYVVHRRQSGRGGAAEVAVAAGEERLLATADFREVPLQALAQKGGAVVVHPWEVELGYGAHFATTQEPGQRLVARVAYRLGEVALGLNVEAGMGHKDTDAHEVDERWVGLEPQLELRLLGAPEVRLALGPSFEYIGQRLRRHDANRIERAGYVGTRDYAAAAWGAHALAGVRIPLPLGRTWFECDITGAWHEVKTEAGIQNRWRAGGLGVLGARF